MAIVCYNIFRYFDYGFFKRIVKEIGDEYTQLASEVESTEEFIDTGSYIFNSLVSGSVFGGVSRNKITAIAGESSTGKTFFSLAVVKNFLDNNPDGYCLYLTPRLLSTGDSLSLEELISKGSLLSTW